VTRWTPQQARLHPFITGEKYTKPFVVCPMCIMSWVLITPYCFHSQMVWQSHSTNPHLAVVGLIQNGLTVDWYLRNLKVQGHTQTRPHTIITLPSTRHTLLRLNLKLLTHSETHTSPLKTLSNTHHPPIILHLTPSPLYISLSNPSSLHHPLSNNLSTHITYPIPLLLVIVA